MYEEEGLSPYNEETSISRNADALEYEKVELEHSLYLLKELLSHLKTLSEEEMNEKKIEAANLVSICSIT